MSSLIYPLPMAEYSDESASRAYVFPTTEYLRQIGGQEGTITADIAGLRHMHTAKSTDGDGARWGSRAAEQRSGESGVAGGMGGGRRWKW